MGPHPTACDVTLTPLAETNYVLGPTQCAACGHNPTAFEWVDGDSLAGFGDALAEPDRCRCDGALMWGPCPRCRVRYYSLEISILAASEPGTTFLQDHFFLAGAPAQYRARQALEAPWLVCHFTHVENLLVDPHHSSVTHRRKADWLDIHYFEPFLHPAGLSGAFATAAQIANSMLPQLLALKWQGPVNLPCVG